MHDWHDIATKHGPLVWSVAYRVLQNHDDAADCHQEVFVDAMGRAAGRRIHNWAGFLRWLTVRRALDRLRTRVRQRQTIDSGPSLVDVCVPARSDTAAEWQELVQIVRTQLLDIPEQQAQVFWLHCVEDMPMDDVALQLAVSANHARVLLHRCRAKLRAAIQRNHPSLIER